MSSPEREALAARLLKRDRDKTDYERGSTALLALLPGLYGVLTWACGRELWAGSSVYSTALTLPGAPQSWGTLFLVLSVGMIVSAVRQRHRWTCALTSVTALVLALFMVTFSAEFFTSGNKSALPPALAWGVFSLLYLNRARYAWVSRR